MPQLLILVLAGAGVLAGYRLLQREMQRVARDLRQADAALRQKEQAAPRETLVRDPESGIYRPKRV